LGRIAPFFVGAQQAVSLPGGLQFLVALRLRHLAGIGVLIDGDGELCDVARAK